MRYSTLFVLMMAAGNTFASNWTDLNGLIETNDTPSWLKEPYQISNNTRVIKSDLYLNLSQWVNEQNLQRVKPALVVIVADTLEISDTFNLSVKNQNITIFARKIIGSGRAVFTLGNESSASSVTIISPSMQSPIDIISTLNDGSVKLESVTSTKAALGTSVLLAGNFYQAEAITDDLTGYLQMNPDAYRDILNKSFDMAALLFEKSPQTSAAMLSWIEQVMRKSSNLIKNYPLLSDLYLQTLTFKQFVDFAGKDKNYVPYLDSHLYKGKYETYIDAMVEFQHQYDIVADRTSSETDKIQSAESAIATISDVMHAQQSIISRSKADVDKINKRLFAVKTQYAAQETAALLARTEYLIGVDKWQREQELNAAIAIFKAVADLGSAIGGVFMGNLSGIQAVTSELSKGVPEAINKATELVKNIKSVSSVISEITKTANSIAQLKTQVESKISQDEIASVVNSFNFSIPSIDESNTAWDAMLIELRSNLRYAESLGIKEARTFLIEIEKQILFGKAINATQLRLVTEQSRLIDLMVTAEVSKKQQLRLQDTLAQTTDDKSKLQEIERELSRAVNYFKRPLYVALSNYSNAFKYWALKDSEVSASLNKSYLDYKMDLATIDDEYLRALESFQPAPHDFTIDNYIIDNPEQIAQFKQTGKVSFTIPTNESKFCRFDRVRINTIRVMLEGKTLPYGEEYYLDIANTGSYKDRYQDDDYNFSALPLTRAFYYRLDDAQNNQISIITDGAIAKKLSFLYFEPTPFTTWTATLQDHQAYDLNNVEQIRVVFKGLGIPNGKPCH